MKMGWFLLFPIFVADWIDAGMYICQNCPSFKSDINDYGKIW